MSEVLPKLHERRDARWERSARWERIIAMKCWARGALADVLAAQSLGGNVDSDDEFSEMVDRLYEVLRNGLTRQDLLTVFLELIHNEGAARDAVGILLGHRRDVEKMINDPQ